MKKVIATVLICAVCLLLAGCNPVARKFGGNVEINLKPGEKLSNVTWKKDSLWILTKPMRPTDIAETYSFKEDSTFGLLEGTVTIKEHKE